MKRTYRWNKKVIPDDSTQAGRNNYRRNVEEHGNERNQHQEQKSNDLVFYIIRQDITHSRNAQNQTDTDEVLIFLIVFMKQKIRQDSVLTSQMYCKVRP